MGSSLSWKVANLLRSVEPWYGDPVLAAADFFDRAALEVQDVSDFSCARIATDKRQRMVSTEAKASEPPIRAHDGPVSRNAGGASRVPSRFNDVMPRGDSRHLPRLGVLAREPPAHQQSLPRSFGKPWSVRAGRGGRLSRVPIDPQTQEPAQQ